MKTQRYRHMMLAASLTLLVSINTLATDISGTIVNQVWTSNNSPYRVVGDILVAGLRIEPGVVVLFESNYVFEVAGRLSALGTESMPIIFTRTNGVGWQGIVFNNAPPGSQLHSCIVSGAVNSAIRLLASAAPSLVCCRFVGNSTSGSGGAISTEGQATDLILDGCVFENNSAGVHGGAVRADMSSGTLKVINGCEFRGNIAHPGSGNGNFVGGALYVTGPAVISHAVFDNNSSISRCSSSFDCTVTGRGGAAYFDGNTNVVIRNCLFVGNTVRGLGKTDCFFGGVSRAWGGAIFLADGTLLISNSILRHNVASASPCGISLLGAGIFVNSGSCSAVNVTCAYNTGTGIHGAGATGITNSIVFFNTGPAISGTPAVAYSDVEGGYAGEGNISLNPIFLATNNLMVVLGSSCIDKGITNSAYNDVCSPPSLGSTRNDMGAFGGPGACATLLARKDDTVKVTLFGGIPGYTYLIQGSTNLLDWETLQNYQISYIGDAAYFVEPPNNERHRRFYKLNVQR